MASCGRVLAGEAAAGGRGRAFGIARAFAGVGTRFAEFIRVGVVGGWTRRKPRDNACTVAIDLGIWFAA